MKWPTALLVCAILDTWQGQSLAADSSKQLMTSSKSRQNTAASTIQHSNYTPQPLKLRQSSENLDFGIVRQLVADNSSFDVMERHFLLLPVEQRNAANALYICNQGYRERCACALMDVQHGGVRGFRCFTHHAPRTCRKLTRCSACLKVARANQCGGQQKSSLHDDVVAAASAGTSLSCTWDCRCRCARQRAWTQPLDNEAHFPCNQHCNSKNNCPGAEDEQPDVCRVSLRIPWFALIPLLLILGLLYMMYHKRRIIRNWCGAGAPETESNFVNYRYKQEEASPYFMKDHEAYMPVSSQQPPPTQSLSSQPLAATVIER